MKIKLDDTHFLNSDQYCYWITQVIAPEGKKPYERRCSGYVTTLAHAVESYIEKRIKSSEADKISKLSAEVKKLKHDIKNWKVNIDGQNKS